MPLVSIQRTVKSVSLKTTLESSGLSDLRVLPLLHRLKCSKCTFVYKILTDNNYVLYQFKTGLLKHLYQNLSLFQGSPIQHIFTNIFCNSCTCTILLFLFCLFSSYAGNLISFSRGFRGLDIKSISASYVTLFNKDSFSFFLSPSLGFSRLGNRFL